MHLFKSSGFLFLFEQTHKHTHTHTHPYTSYTCMYMYIQTHTHTTTHTHKHTHTTTHTQYYSYWPGKGEQEAFGNILVTVEEETAEHYYTTRVITVSNTKVVVLSPLLPGQTSVFVVCV